MESAGVDVPHPLGADHHLRRPGGLWSMGRIRLWRMGRPVVRTDQAGRRIGGLLLYALGQRRVLSQAYSGLMHGLIFYGFVAFFIATSLVGIQLDAGVLILKGDFYLGFELAVNAFTLLFLCGLGLAAIRRYIRRPERLNLRRDDAWVLGALAFIAVTGLSLEVLRLRGQQPAWAHWSWLGHAIARVFGPPPAEPAAIYPYVWWAHQLAVFGLIATLPYTEFLHLVTAPLNIYLRRLDAPGAIPAIEAIEETEAPLGAGSIEQLTWKQLLDGDACTECGRCQDVCPAYAAGQPLSPKGLVMDLRDHMSGFPGALEVAGADRRQDSPLATAGLGHRRSPGESVGRPRLAVGGHPGRDPMGLYDLPRLRTGMPGPDRAGERDCGHAALPGPRGRAYARHAGPGVTEHRTAGRPLGPAAPPARRVGNRPRRPADGRGGPGRCALLGGLRR